MELALVTRRGAGLSWKGPPIRLIEIFPIMSSPEHPPIAPASATEDVHAPGSGAENQTYREKGAAERAKFNESIKKKKAWVSGIFSKMGSFLTNAKDSTIDHAFATRYMVADGADYVGNKASEGLNALGDKAVAFQEAGDRFLSESVDSAEKWISDKKEIAQAVAAIGLNVGIGAAATVREEVIQAKEKISKGYENLAGKGASLIERARQRGAGALNAWNERRMEAALRKQREMAQMRLDSAVAQEESLRTALTQAVARRVALQKNLFAGGPDEQDVNAAVAA